MAINYSRSPAEGDNKTLSNSIGKVMSYVGDWQVRGY